MSRCITVFRNSLVRLLLIACLAGVLTGCVLPGTVTGPTPYPADYIPTVIYMTAQAINAATMAAVASPTETLEPTPTLELPTTTPAPTATYTPVAGSPLAAIRIDEPGPMSRVASPLVVHALAVAGDSHRVEVALYGEDGRLLARTLVLVSGYPGGNSLSIKLPFEIRAAGETGIVQVSTKDGHGHIQSLNSVRVLLMSTGTSQITPPGNMIYERVAFYNLQPDSHISGGTLTLKGSYTPVNDSPTILELQTADGKLLGQRVLSFDGTGSQYFETTLPFKVDKETAARLYLYQDDDILEGKAYIYSQPLALEP